MKTAGYSGQAIHRVQYLRTDRRTQREKPPSDLFISRRVRQRPGNRFWVAGAPLTADRLKCELKPVDRRDYKAPLTDTQVAGLRAIFPQGVCDYSRSGVAQRASETWLSYSPSGASQTR